MDVVSGSSPVIVSWFWSTKLPKLLRVRLNRAPEPAGVVASVTLTELVGATVYDEAGADTETPPTASKVMLNVAPAAAGVVMSVTETAPRGGLVVYDPLEKIETPV